MQKLVFLAQLQGQRTGIVLSHFRFFRYQLGPFSAFLANDITALEGVGVVTKSSRRLTNRGQFLHDYILGALKDDGREGLTTAALGIVDGIARRYGGRTGRSLMEHVYGLTVPVIDYGGQRVRVAEIPGVLLCDLNPDGAGPIQGPRLRKPDPVRPPSTAGVHRLDCRLWRRDPPQGRRARRS